MQQLPSTYPLTTATSNAHLNPNTPHPTQVIQADGGWSEVLPFVFKLCVSEVRAMSSRLISLAGVKWSCLRINKPAVPQDAAYKQTGLDLLRALAEEVAPLPSSSSRVLNLPRTLNPTP